MDNNYGSNMFNELNLLANSNVFVNKPESEIFYKPAEFIDKFNTTETKLLTFFTYDTKFGQSGAIGVTEGYIYVPKHCIEMLMALRNNYQYVKVVNDGKCGVRLEPYDYNGETYYTLRLFPIEN